VVDNRGEDMNRKPDTLEKTNDVRNLSAVELPSPEPTVFNYDPITVYGDIAYLAGQIPKQGGKLAFVGNVGAQVNLAQAQQAAVICVDQALAWLAHSAGGLENIDRILRSNCFIAHVDGFEDISKVADAGSSRLIEVLGSIGRHSRSVIGVKSLPRNSPVLLEMTVALKNKVNS